MKKMRILLLTICMMVFFTGCLQADELKDRAIIQAVGVDYEDGIYTVTIQKFSPDPGGGQTVYDAASQNNKVIQTQGVTITDALNEVSLQQGKDVFYGNNTLLIIGRKTCENGIGSAINFFNSDNEARPTIHVAMSDTDAADIITTQLDQGITPALALDMMIDSSKANGIVSEVTLMEVIQAINSEGNNPYMPIIASGKDFNGEPSLTLIGTAFFKGDQYVGEFEGNQTRGLLWLVGKVNRTTINIDSEKIGRCSLYADRTKTKIKTTIEQGVPHFYVEIKARGTIREISRVDGGGIETKDVDLLEDRVEETITHEITLALNKAIGENQTDIFRFCDHVKQVKLRYWKEIHDQWNEILPKSTIDVQVKFNIDRIGLESKYKSKH